MHLPRSVFSERQIDILLWLLQVNNVDNVPSVKSVKLIKDTIQQLCGIRSIPYDGALGHKYYVNSLPDIIQQEMMNPRVRPLLHFYPEDTGELDPELLTPVVRLHNQDFFVFEPALLSITRELDCGWVVEDFHSFEVSGKRSSSKQHLVYRVHTQSMVTDGVFGHHGARVFVMPLWLYCDDTSGNLLKKWNKHNSFLFTAAGLPRADIHQEYNVHFLCTSNLAPPLEMLDGIVDQLEESWKQGIWAWDCVHEEYVHVIPSVLALLVDNPMQSEMACHIGLMGKYFCCISAAQPEDTDHSVGEASGSESDAHADAPPKSTRKRAKETMEEMVIWVKCMVDRRTAKTSTGIKDTFLDSFLNRLAESHCKIRGGNRAKQAALNRVKETLPKIVTSIDPHTDAPVEILHTVLLGFIKYLWCDVVSVRIGKDKLKCELLETSLSSVDVSGLGLSHLAGHTLVQYAGSLVGRDFCAIAQVALFMLHDLVPMECYDTWVALSNMIPLIWQPKIENSMEHLCNLMTSINNFLACTARWTP
ncbi:hypothetical protein DFJ58DRAFT_720359 [Suillus subalutaceus]|uniref:uncharacterized protein n=1 Tax=Suillus subalutaceus TaxID=48586 RepID=UPI001B85DF7A|nr:uncharacterized protein DFJ58DRAFT_720359 [Suillus subalutaceus]KAG1813074.1 hypothetical protein DFJ58DRAFT_720359 [Suillus subalutaceus]